MQHVIHYWTVHTHWTTAKKPHTFVVVVNSDFESGGSDLDTLDGYHINLSATNTDIDELEENNNNTPNNKTDNVYERFLLTFMTMFVINLVIIHCKQKPFK